MLIQIKRISFGTVYSKGFLHVPKDCIVMGIFSFYYTFPNDPNFQVLILLVICSFLLGHLNLKINEACMALLIYLFYFSLVFMILLLTSCFRSTYCIQVINDLLDPTGQNLRIREDAQVLLSIDEVKKWS